MRLTMKRILESFKDRRIRYAVFVGVVIVVTVVVFAVRGGPVGDERNWVKVTRGTFTRELVESGEVWAVKAEYIEAPHEWRMDLQVIDLVPEGTMVKEGDFLIQFDTSTLEEELDGDMDNLKQAEADLRSIDTQQASRKSEMETNLQIAKQTLEGAELQLSLLQFESKNRQEEARLDLEKAKIRYSEAQKKIETQKIIDATERQKVAVRLEQAQMDVERSKKRIKGLTLRAPISGMVVCMEIGGRGPDNPRYKVSIGDKVDSGEAIISIPDLSKMKLVLKVNEIDAGYLKSGQKVFIKLDAFENTIYHGSVGSVSTLLEKSDSAWWRGQQKAPSFEVIVFIDETSDLLKPGMTAQAKIVVNEINDVYAVPTGAVFELADGSSVVYTKKRFPKAVPVTLGKRNDRFVIVENGLREGDEITLTPPEGSAYPLGWYAEMERRRTEFEELLTHIDTMEELGIKYDPAQKDTTGSVTGQTPAGDPSMIKSETSPAPAGTVVRRVVTTTDN